MKKKILILAMAGMLAATSLTGCGSFKDCLLYTSDAADD